MPSRSKTGAVKGHDAQRNTVHAERGDAAVACACCSSSFGRHQCSTAVQRSALMPMTTAPCPTFSVQGVQVVQLSTQALLAEPEIHRKPKFACRCPPPPSHRRLQLREGESPRGGDWKRHPPRGWKRSARWHYLFTRSGLYFVRVTDLPFALSRNRRSRRRSRFSVTPCPWMRTLSPRIPPAEGPPVSKYALGLFLSAAAEEAAEEDAEDEKMRFALRRQPVA